jgi:folate-binding protein YgfZ
MVNLVTPLAELHRDAGSVLAPYFGVALPAQFGDPLVGHRLARQHVALVDTNFRAVFSLAGPDRVRYLNAVLTSDVRDLAPGQGAIGLLLNPQGHILAELETFALDDRLLIFGHAFIRERTFATLDKFIIMDDATLTDETDQSGTLSLEGPAAPEIVRKLTGVALTALPERGHTQATIMGAVGEVPCRVIHHSLYGLPGAEFLVRRESLASLWNVLSAAVRARDGAAVGYRALDALRLEAGVPWFGADFDEQHIPHEAALEHTHISYTKGCYTGQEIVERVRSRGHVNRRRAALLFSGAQPPAPGARLTAAGAEAGHVTSAAFSPLAGRAIGMGYLRREHTQVGSRLDCQGLQAEVIELPLPAVRSKAAPEDHA